MADKLEITTPPIKIKLKTEPILTDKNKTLRMLEDLEMKIIDNEKEARSDVEKCQPSKLFNLIARASMYRAFAGSAEELYPEDLDIKEHVKSSRILLTQKSLELTSKFEEDCLCISKKRI